MTKKPQEFPTKAPRTAKAFVLWKLPTNVIQSTYELDIRSRQTCLRESMLFVWMKTAVIKVSEIVWTQPHRDPEVWIDTWIDWWWMRWVRCMPEVSKWIKRENISKGYEWLRMNESAVSLMNSQSLAVSLCYEMVGDGERSSTYKCSVAKQWNLSRPYFDTGLFGHLWPRVSSQIPCRTFLYLRAKILCDVDYMWKSVKIVLPSARPNYRECGCKSADVRFFFDYPFESRATKANYSSRRRRI